MDDHHSKANLNVIFKVLLGTNLILNLYYGILLSASNEIKHAFGLSQFQFGFIYSLIYIAEILGFKSLNLMMSLKYRKCLLIILTLIVTIFTCGFYMSKSITYFILCQIIIGYSRRIFEHILSWWQYYYIGKRNACLDIALKIYSPFGLIIGYYITVFCIIYANWKYALLLMSTSLSFCIMLLFGLNNNHFDNLKMDLEPKEKLEEKSPTDLENFSSIITHNKDYNNEGISHLKHEKKTDSHVSSPTVFDQDYMFKENNTPSEEIEGFGWELRNNEEYFLSLCIQILAALVIVAIQNWFTDYMLNHVMIKASISIYIGFVLVLFSAPWAATLFGTLQKKYDEDHPISLLNLTVLLSMIASLTVIKMISIKNEITIYMLLWVVICSLTLTVQNLQRYDLHSLKFKKDIISKGQLIIYLIGGIGGSNIYALICSVSGGEKSPYGMYSLALVTIMSFLFSLLLRSKNKGKEKS